MSEHLRRMWAARIAVSNEAQHGEFTLHYHKPDMDYPRHRVLADDANGNFAGELAWHPNTHRITNVNVAEKHRRKGLATAMMGLAQQQRPAPQHSPDRTNDGDAWAKSVGGPIPRRSPLFQGNYPIWRESSWRAMDPGSESGHGVWRDHDAVIVPDHGQTGRGRHYTTYTFGEPIASRPSLSEAQEAVHEVYGPQQWKHEQLPKLTVTHRDFGDTDEFSDPHHVWHVHQLPRL